MTNTIHSPPAALALVALAFAGTPAAASAQIQLEPPPEPEAPVYWGLGFGPLGTEFRLGVRDAFAEDVGFRADLYYALHLYDDDGVEPTAGPGIAFHALYTPGEPTSLRGYGGFGVEASSIDEESVLCVGPCNGWHGAYFGGTGVAGFEVGGRTARFFMEAGLTTSHRISGGEAAPDWMFRPRFELGMHFN